jgi:hypothetical protein
MDDESSTGGYEAPAIMDDGDAWKSDCITRLEDWKERVLRLLFTYRGNRVMAQDCLALALGYGDMIGMHTATEIALKHFGDKKKKAAVTKCVLMFSDSLGLPSQRPTAGRQAMANARKKQLK